MLIFSFVERLQNGTMNLTARKSDCTLQVLNAQMAQVAQFDGVIQLFAHDYAGFRYWHGVVDIADADSVDDQPKDESLTDDWQAKDQPTDG